MKELEIAISKRHLPIDELGKGWLLLSTYIPAIVFFFGGLVCYFAPISNVSPSHKVLFLSLGIFTLLFTLYLSINERKLISVQTNLSQIENSILMEKISTIENWTHITRKAEHQVIYIKHKKWLNEFKLIVIHLENELLINLRNRGTI